LSQSRLRNDTVYLKSQIQKQPLSSSKYYAIGVLPFFVSKFLALTVGKDMSSFILNIASENGLFSFLAFFLFLVVLPLVYAPETLPEKIMKDRDLQSYVDKAKKKVQKQSEKSTEKKATNPKTVTENPSVKQKKTIKSTRKRRNWRKNTIKQVSGLGLKHVLPRDTHDRMQSAVPILLWRNHG
jgi:Sec-independent protein translocase protein TatA